VPAANARLADATARPEVRHEQDQRRQQSSNVKHDLIGGYTLPLHRESRSHDRDNRTLRKRELTYRDRSHPVLTKTDTTPGTYRRGCSHKPPATRSGIVGEVDATASIQPAPKSGSRAIRSRWGDKGSLAREPRRLVARRVTFALNLIADNAYDLALAERVRDRDRRHCSGGADCMVVSPEEFVT
jgi:hypothetical protein